MTVGAVVAGLLLGLAVLLWPTRSGVRRRVTRLVLRAGSTRVAVGAQVGAGDGGLQAEAPGNLGPGGVTALLRAVRSAWREDPVEVVRRWRLHHRPDDLVTGALSVLEGIGPAIRAGLTPADAVRIATAADRSELLDGGPSELRGSPGARTLSTALADGLSRGVPLSDVWQRLAVRADSRDLAFVAAAWHLSESTGAPLAVAVERAAEALRQGRSRQRRVAVAVAGPRATVVVLTLLPLAGPLFGLACGVGPRELYLSTPIATMSLIVGLALIAAGRRWCRRLVRRAVQP